MDATAIDTLFTLATGFALLGVCAGGVLVLPWTDEEVGASAAAFGTLLRLPVVLARAATRRSRAPVPPAGPHAVSSQLGEAVGA